VKIYNWRLNMRRHWMTGLLLGSLTLIVGCGKEEPPAAPANQTAAPAAQPDAPETPAAPESVAPALSDAPPPAPDTPAPPSGEPDETAGLSPDERANQAFAKINEFLQAENVAGAEAVFVEIEKIAGSLNEPNQNQVEVLRNKIERKKNGEE